MTDDAARYVRSGDGQVEYRVVGSGPSVVWVPGLVRARRHDRDGSRVFVAPAGLPGPVWALRPP
jgi:hypothetical protein